MASSSLPSSGTSLFRRHPKTWRARSGPQGTAGTGAVQHLWSWTYPLVICYIAIANGHRNSGFSHKKMVIVQFAMLNYPRVFLGRLLLKFFTNPQSNHLLQAIISIVFGTSKLPRWNKHESLVFVQGTSQRSILVFQGVRIISISFTGVSEFCIRQAELDGIRSWMV